MKNIEIDANRVRLAQIRYFDVEANASEIPMEKAYAFLVKVNGVYINPFNPLEEVPVYDRAWYSNTTLEGREFGTKIILAQGEVQEGKCYILEMEKGEKIFDKEVVTIKDLEDYMFQSDEFFVDRLTIGKKKPWKPKEMLSRYRQMENDYIKEMKLEAYLNREEEYQKIK